MMKRIKPQTIVVGAGIAGLASAIRMARLGYVVDVYEKEEKPGGKLNEFCEAGFRFDMGPSLFTLPELMDELLDEDLRFQHRRLDIITRYFFEDGIQLTAYADVEKFAREVEEKTGVTAGRVQTYLVQAHRIFRLTAPIFIFNSFHKLTKLLRWSNLFRAFQFVRLKVFTTLHKLNYQSFKDRRIVQLFDRYATYNGSNPYKTPGTLSVISHLEHNLGAYFPAKGMYVIVESLFRQAKRLGVKFHFNEAVEEVIVEEGRITGIRKGDLFIKCDLLVSDVDISYFYRSLLPDKKRFLKISKQERSSSALIYYWGIDKEFSQLDLHNIFFSKNYREEFTCLFDQKTITADPTVYLFISNKENPDDAPAGKENWFVMVNAPEDIGQDWDSLKRETRSNIVRKLNRLLDDDIERHILFERSLDPVRIEEHTGSFNGSMYGPSSNTPFSAFNRHANFRRDIKGLYFVGGSVHPGGGIPLCLASAKIVGEMIEEKFNGR